MPEMPLSAPAAAAAAAAAAVSQLVGPRQREANILTA